MQQHSMTGTDRGGYLTQGAVADTAGGELLDQRVQQLTAPAPVRRGCHRHGGGVRNGS